jgi:hypothetical protein
VTSPVGQERMFKAIVERQTLEAQRDLAKAAAVREQARAAHEPLRLRKAMSRQDTYKRLIVCVVLLGAVLIAIGGLGAGDRMIFAGVALITLGVRAIASGVKQTRTVTGEDGDPPLVLPKV